MHNDKIYGVEWVKPEQLAWNPLWIANNQRIIFINFYQDI